MPVIMNRLDLVHKLHNSIKDVSTMCNLSLRILKKVLQLERRKRSKDYYQHV